MFYAFINCKNNALATVNLTPVSEVLHSNYSLCGHQFTIANKLTAPNNLFFSCLSLIRMLLVGSSQQI